MALRVAELQAVITAQTGDFDAGMARASNKVNAFGSVASGAARLAGAALLGIGAAGVAGLGSAIKVAADFEFQMDAVNAAMGGLDTSQMAAMEQQALDLGASTKFSAGEVAGVQEMLGRAGVAFEDVLGGATQAALDMSAATGEDVVTSAEAAAAAMNMFGLSGDQVTGIADTFTAGLNNSSATLADFQRGVNTLGPVMANLARYADDPVGAFEDTTAAVAFFNSRGLKAADAGVSLARGMTNLADPTSEASSLMQQLGVSAFDAEGNFLPLPDLFDQLQGAMGGMSDQAREQALATIFGAEAADVMNQAIKEGGDPLREYERLMQASGQAAEQAGIRQDNLRGSIEELGGAFETAQIAVGKLAIPQLREWVDTATRGVNAFTKAFSAGVDSGLNPFHAAALGVVNAIEEMAGGTTGATQAARNLMAAIQRGAPILEQMTKTYEAMGDTGLAARIRALGNALFVATGVNLQGATERLADFTNAVADLGAAVLAGDFDTVGSMIQDALGNIGDTIGAVTDWVLNVGAPAAIQWAGDVLGTIGTWIQGQLQSLVGEGNEVNIGTVTVAIAGFVLTLVDLASMLWAEIEAALQSVGESIIANAEGAGASLGKTIGGALASGIQAALSIGVQEGLAGAADENYGVATGYGGGASLGEQMVSALDLARAAQDFANAFGEQFSAAMAPAEGAIENAIIQWIKDDLAKGPPKLGPGEAQQGIFDAIGEFLFPTAGAAGIDDAVNQSSEQVDQFAADLGQRMGRSMGQAMSSDAFSGSLETAMRENADVFEGPAQALNDALMIAMEKDLATVSADGEQQAGEGGAMFVESIAAGLEASLGSVDPRVFQGVGTALSGAIGDAIGVAMADPAATLPSATTGERAGGGMGQGLITSIVTGLETSLASVPPDTFQPLGSALMTKIQAGMGMAMANVTQGGGDAASQQAQQVDGGGMAQSMIRTIATQLQYGVATASPDIFAPVGAALMTKVTEAVGVAMAGVGPQTSGQQLSRTMGDAPTGGMGATMVQGLATSMAASVMSADPALFAPVGAAIQAKITAAVSMAMSAGAEGAGAGTGSGGPAGGGGAAAAGSTIAQALVDTLVTQIDAADFSTVTSVLRVKIQDALNAMYEEAGGAATTGKEAAAGGPGAAIAASIVTQVENADWSGLTAAFETKTAEAMEGMRTGIETGMEQVRAAVDTAITEITNRLQELATTAQTEGQNAGTSFAAGLEGGMQQAQTAAETAIAAIESAFQQLAASAAQAGAEAGSGFASGMQSGMSQAQAAADAAVAAITSILQSAAAGAEAAGAAVGAGFAAGIARQQGAVEAAAANLAAAASAAIASAAQIASPSRVTMRLGALFGEGWLQGVLATVRDAARAGSDLADATAAGMAGAAESAADDGSASWAEMASQIGEGVWSGMLDQVPRTEAAARYLMDQAFREAEGIAEQWAARAAGQSMLATFYENQLNDIDPNLDPGLYARIDQKRRDALARSASAGVTATNARRSDVEGKLQQARRSGADPRAIRALEMERRLLIQLADAQYDLFKAPADSAAAEIAGMRVDALQQKLADLADLDVAGIIASEMEAAMASSAEATAGATERMNADITSVAGTAEKAAAALGTSFQTGADVAQQAIEETLGSIGGATGMGESGRALGEQFASGINQGMQSGLAENPLRQEGASLVPPGMYPKTTSDGARLGSSLAAGMKTSLPQATDIAAKAVTQIEKVFADIGQTGLLAGRDLGVGFRDGIAKSNAPDVAEGLLDQTERAITTGGADAAEAANDAGLDIGQRLSGAITSSGADAVRTANSVNTRINNTIGSLGGAFGNINLGQVDTGNITDKVRGAITQIGQMASAGKTQGQKVGESLIDGQIAGLNNKEGALYARVKEIVDAAIKAAQQAAQSQSPSRRMMEQGEFLGEGLAIGIEDKTARVIRSVRDLVDAAAEETQTFDGALGVEVGPEGRRRRGPGSGQTVVNTYNRYEIPNAIFESGTDWDDFFAARRHEAEISNARA